MASKKDLEFRIEQLEAQLNKSIKTSYFMFSENVTPTILGKVEAIAKHLGISFVVTEPTKASVKVVIKETNAKKGGKKIMASLNSVSLTGNLVRDIELKTTQSGTQVASATIAVNGYKEDDTSFINLVMFSKTAEVAEKYTSKGQMIGITGRLQQRTYENKDGVKVNVVEVVVDNLQLPPKSASNNQQTKDVVLEDIDDKPISLADIPF